MIGVLDGGGVVPHVTDAPAHRTVLPRAGRHLCRVRVVVAVKGSLALPAQSPDTCHVWLLSCESGDLSMSMPRGRRAPPSPEVMVLWALFCFESVYRVNACRRDISLSKVRKLSAGGGGAAQCHRISNCAADARWERVAHGSAHVQVPPPARAVALVPRRGMLDGEVAPERPSPGAGCGATSLLLNERGAEG